MIDAKTRAVILGSADLIWLGRGRRVRAVILDCFGLDTAEVEKFAARSELRQSGVDSGLTAIRMKSVDCFLQQGDLSLVVGVVL